MYQKKILRVSSELYPETIGGIGVHVDRLSSGQTRLGWHNTLLTIGTADQPRVETRNGYTIVRVPYVIKPFGNKLGPAILNELIQLKSSHSIIHAHSHLLFSSNVVAVINSLTSSPPVIITCHGVWSQSVPKFVQTFYLHSLGLITLNSAERVICYSVQERNELIRLGVKPKKIVVIPNGVDTSFFKPPQKINKCYRILWVGRFVRGKRPELAVGAFAKIKKEFPYASLVMLGTGPERESCRRMVQQLGLSDSIIFSSYIPEKKMPKLYSESLCLINTSDQEGVPRTLLEAMSCETPVVAPNLPQFVPIIRGSGLTFRRGNIDELTAKVSSLANNDRLQEEMGKKGRLRVVSHYSWENHVKKTIKLYESILEND